MVVYLTRLSIGTLLGLEFRRYYIAAILLGLHNRALIGRLPDCHFSPANTYGHCLSGPSSSDTFDRQATRDLVTRLDSVDVNPYSNAEYEPARDRQGRKKVSM